MYRWHLNELEAPEGLYSKKNGQKMTKFDDFGPLKKDLKCARGFQALKVIYLAC